MNDQMRELLPCPFCGEVRQDWITVEGCQVYCHNCGSKGPASINPGRQWNSRPPATVDQEALEARWIEQSVDLKDVSWKAFVRAWYRTGWEDAVKVQALHPKAVTREEIKTLVLGKVFAPGVTVDEATDAIHTLLTQRAGGE